MAKTAAQRQADYRAQRAQAGSAERRLNTWINTEAFGALETLAQRYGVTRRGVIELLLASELKKPRALGVAKTKPVAPKKARLPRNEPSNTTPPVAVTRRTNRVQPEGLLRNIAAPVAEPVLAEPVLEKPPAEKKMPARPSGTQFEFEL